LSGESVTTVHVVAGSIRVAGRPPISGIACLPWVAASFDLDVREGLAARGFPRPCLEIRSYHDRLTPFDTHARRRSALSVAESKDVRVPERPYVGRYYRAVWSWLLAVRMAVAKTGSR
jgi:hypothetical protein